MDRKVEAKELWNDANAIEKKTAYQSEERFVRVGSIGTKIWAAVFTLRDGNVRLISVRRARRGERQHTKTLPLTAEEFDRRFDEGESVFDLGFSKKGWTRPGLVSKRFNVDVPAHMLQKLDDAAMLRGMTRQALVKSWLYDRLEKQSAYRIQ